MMPGSDLLTASDNHIVEIDVTTPFTTTVYEIANSTTYNITGQGFDSVIVLHSDTPVQNYTILISSPITAEYNEVRINLVEGSSGSIQLHPPPSSTPLDTINLHRGSVLNKSGFLACEGLLVSMAQGINHIGIYSSDPVDILVDYIPGGSDLVIYTSSRESHIQLLHANQNIFIAGATVDIPNPVFSANTTILVAQSAAVNITNTSPETLHINDGCLHLSNQTTTLQPPSPWMIKQIHQHINFTWNPSIQNGCLAYLLETDTLQTQTAGSITITDLGKNITHAILASPGNLNIIDPEKGKGRTVNVNGGFVRVFSADSAKLYYSVSVTHPSMPLAVFDQTDFEKVSVTCLNISHSVTARGIHWQFNSGDEESDGVTLKWDLRGVYPYMCNGEVRTDYASDIGVVFSEELGRIEMRHIPAAVRLDDRNGTVSAVVDITNFENVAVSLNNTHSDVNLQIAPDVLNVTVGEPDEVFFLEELAMFVCIHLDNETTALWVITPSGDFGRTQIQAEGFAETNLAEKPIINYGAAAGNLAAVTEYPMPDSSDALILAGGVPNGRGTRFHIQRNPDNPDYCLTYTQACSPLSVMKRKISGGVPCSTTATQDACLRNSNGIVLEDINTDDTLTFQCQTTTRTILAGTPGADLPKDTAIYPYAPWVFDLFGFLLLFTVALGWIEMYFTGRMLVFGPIWLALLSTAYQGYIHTLTDDTDHVRAQLVLTGTEFMVNVYSGEYCSSSNGGNFGGSEDTELVAIIRDVSVALACVILVLLLGYIYQNRSLDWIFPWCVAKKDKMRRRLRSINAVSVRANGVGRRMDKRREVKRRIWIAVIRLVVVMKILLVPLLISHHLISPYVIGDWVMTWVGVFFVLFTTMNPAAGSPLAAKPKWEVVMNSAQFLIVTAAFFAIPFEAYYSVALGRVTESWVIAFTIGFANYCNLVIVQAILVVQAVTIVKRPYRRRWVVPLLVGYGLAIVCAVGAGVVGGVWLFSAVSHPYWHAWIWGTLAAGAFALVLECIDRKLATPPAHTTTEQSPINGDFDEENNYIDHDNLEDSESD